MTSLDATLFVTESTLLNTCLVRTGVESRDDGTLETGDVTGSLEVSAGTLAANESLSVELCSGTKLATLALVTSRRAGLAGATGALLKVLKRLGLEEPSGVRRRLGLTGHFCTQMKSSFCR